MSGRAEENHENQNQDAIFMYREIEPETYR
jgi:hypothetical protein